ncbi:MAG: hypothetical protein IPK68_22605 [Bdellovibrionales bacterium]|nr:hypothetical protein [Bdellovibrionales bacterium]
MGRDFESLGFGWVTFDRLTTNTISENETMLLDSVIRFLVSHYKTRQDERNNYNGFEDQQLPKYFTDWIEAGFWNIYGGQNRSQISSSLLEKLTALGVTNQRFQISLDNIYIHRADEHYWKCTKCSAIHLFKSDERCRRVRRFSACSGTLEQLPLSDLLSEANYYREYGHLGRADSPLRTEELVGHTDKMEQRERQLAFKGKFPQDIPIPQDIPKEKRNEWLEKYYGIDCLSVTTTMEAGVDIGGLKAVFMANMPPKRFNYQQRVGRAGRRDDKLATSITFCKGQKHDEFYFANQILMVGEKTASPSLDIKNDRILCRVLLRECLWRLRIQTPDFATSSYGRTEGDFNNGQFGALGDFRTRAPNVLAGFDAIASSIIQFANKIRPNVPNEACVREVRGMLESVSTNLESLIEKYGEAYSLTEAISLEGYLPLYGLPIRDVALIHSDPNVEPNDGAYPIRAGIISRNEDYALSEYAPGKNVIKEKRIMKCVGVGWPQKDSGTSAFRGRRRIDFGPPALPREFTECRSCGALFLRHGIDQCFDCGATNASLKQFVGWRPNAYITDFRAEKDYDGFLGNERTHVSVYPTSMGNGQSLQIQKSGNGITSSFPGQILRLNSNSGDGYSFTRTRGNQAMPGAYVEDSMLGIARVPGWQDLGDNDEKQDNIALFSEQRSDVLLCSIDKVDQEKFKLSAEYLHTPAALAGWDSLAEILGRTITLLEDIEPSELAVGKKLWRRQMDDGQSVLNWAAFIVDNLDNGAGYSSKYSQSAQFINLLTQAETLFVSNLIHPHHESTCTSSCYKCLRSYYNRFLHANLDWRLGYDLLRLMKDKDSAVTLENQWWDRFVFETLFVRLNELSSNSFTVKKTSEGKVFVRRDLALIPLHPFHIEHFSMHLKERKVASELGVAKALHLDVLNFERAPVAELLKKMS